MSSDNNWWKDQVVEWDSDSLTKETLNRKRKREHIWITEKDLNEQFSHIVILGKQ